MALMREKSAKKNGFIRAVCHPSSNIDSIFSIKCRHKENHDLEGIIFRSPIIMHIERWNIDQIPGFDWIILAVHSQIRLAHDHVIDLIRGTVVMRSGRDARHIQGQVDAGILSEKDFFSQITEFGIDGIFLCYLEDVHHGKLVA